MADLSQAMGGTFNANDVEPSMDFSPIPPGDYPAMVVESEMKATKAGNGQYLQLKLAIVDGEFKGRYIWERLNLVNPNQQAVDIARAQFSSICRAIGQMEVSDSSQLHNMPLTVSISYRPARDGQDADPRYSFKKPGGAQPAQQAAKPAKQPQAASKPATASAAPWA